METKDGMEREINLIKLFWDILFGWRQIICFGVVFALLFGGVRYVRDNKNYKAAQNFEEEEAELTFEEQEQVDNAKTMMERIEKYQKYLDESALMQINPYEKPVAELQYYVESDYTYNYTKDNRSDYTSDLMALYYNYVKSGEMSNKLIETLELSIDQSDFSELCAVSQNGRTMAITVTCAEKGKLKEISKFIKEELSKKEIDFQEVGSHKLKLLRESQNVVADTDLAEKKNTYSTNIANINTQLNTLKTNMSEQQLKLLRDEAESESDKEVIAKPNFSYKFMLLGAFFGVFLICVWIACKAIFAARLQSSEEIRTLYGVKLLGEVNMQVKRKKILSVIDDKLLLIKNRRKKKLSVEQQIKMIAANIGLSCKQQDIKQIYMTGSEYKNLDNKTLNMLKQELVAQNVQVTEGGDIFYDADSLKRGTDIGNILFIEQVGLSIYDEIFNELNLAKEQKNCILGVVVWT